MSENKDTHIKVIPGGIGLGGNVPKEYRDMMAQYNAAQLLNKTVEENKPLQPKPNTVENTKKGDCGCGK